MTNINYSFLFTVELLHKFFADGISKDFTITPSALTKSVLNGNKMLAKQFGNKLLVGMAVDDSNKAFMIPAATTQLTFIMRLSSPYFYNYTNLPSAFTPGKIYYFTNRNNNTGNTKNFISQLIGYSNSQEYLPGDIAADAGGTMFECIKSCQNVDPSVANSANWRLIDKNQYVSEADALQWLPTVSTYTFPTSQTSADIQVLGYKVADKNFTDNVLSKIIPLGAGAKSFKLDLSALSPGKYKLTINGVSKWIYINNELAMAPAFAVIDIYNDANLASAYALLTGTSLNSPLYTIDFLNRSTIWKYILNSTSKGVITSSGGFGFPTTDASTIISKSPIPLSETPLDVSLKLSTVGGVDVTPFTVADIACASPQRLTRFENAPDTYACSEIFLNY